MDIMYSVQVLNRAFKTFFKVLDRNSWITGSPVRNLKCEMASGKSNGEKYC